MLFLQVVSKLGIEDVSVYIRARVYIYGVAILQDPDLALSTKKEQAELLQEVSSVSSLLFYVP